MIVEYKDPGACTSQGRNGMAYTIAIEAIVSRKINLVTLIPITSKGKPQNCSIDIPLTEFLELAERIKKEVE